MRNPEITWFKRYLSHTDLLLSLILDIDVSNAGVIQSVVVDKTLVREPQLDLRTTNNTMQSHYHHHHHHHHHIYFSIN